MPAHFPTDEHGLREFDGGLLLRARRSGGAAFTPDWNTAIYDFGRPEVVLISKCQRAVLARGHHIDRVPGRCVRSASMLLLDYSRKEG